MKKITIATMAGLSVAMAGCGAATDVASTPVRTAGGAAAYRDGEYSATGQYGNLPSSIGVSVTLDDDVITAVTVTPHATNPTSRDLQERFAEAIPQLVVGRDIDEVDVSRVAGSSATPVGFNAAIDQIKAAANR
jgi:uncharacterized protein with FMN-binding domain